MPLSPGDWNEIQSLADELAERGNENRRDKLRRWMRENALFFVLLTICIAVVVTFSAFIVPFWVEHWGSLQTCPTGGAVGC